MNLSSESIKNWQAATVHPNHMNHLKISLTNGETIFGRSIAPLSIDGRWNIHGFTSEMKSVHMEIMDDDIVMVLAAAV